MKDGEITKNRILEAAMNDFAKYGYEGSRMERIAGNVGINKASLYFHFKGKEELFRSLFDGIIGRYQTFIWKLFRETEELPIKERLVRFYTGYLEYHWNNVETDFWNRIYYFPPEPMKEIIYRKTTEDKAYFISELSQIFSRGLDSGELSGTTSSAMASTFYYLLTCVALSSDILSYKEASVEMDSCFTVFWRGIAV